MLKVLLVLSAISGVITLALLGFGHPLLAMAGMVVTLVLGAFESLLRTYRDDKKEESDAK